MELKTGVAAVRVFGAIAGKMIPMVNKLIAERKSARDAVKNNFLQDILDSSLENLFGLIKENDPVWKKIVKKIETLAVQPEHFKKPFLQDWISNREVREAVKELAIDQLCGCELNSDLKGFIIESYVHCAGERHEFADATLKNILVVLHTSVEMSSKDPKSLAIALEAVKSLHSHMDLQDVKLDGLNDKMVSLEDFAEENERATASIIDNQKSSSLKQDLMMDFLKEIKATVKSDYHDSRDKQNNDLSAKIDGYISLIDDDPFAALKLYQSLKTECWGYASDSNKFRILANIGASHYIIGDNKKAASYFLQAEKYDPNNPKALRNTTLAYILQNDFEKAADTADKFCNVDVGNPQAHALRILANLQNIEQDQIEDLIPKNFLSDKECLFAVSQAYSFRKDFKNALIWARKGYTSDLNSVSLLSHYAFLLVQDVFSDESLIVTKQISDEKKSLLSEAVTVYEKIWNLVKDSDLIKFNIYALCNLCVVYRLLGEFVKSKMVVTALMDAGIRDFDVLKVAVYNAIDRNSIGEAIDLIKGMSARNAEMDLLLVELLAEQTLFDEALNLLNSLNIEDYEEQEVGFINGFRVRLTGEVYGKDVFDEMVAGMQDKYPEDIFLKISISRFYLELDDKEAASNVLLGAKEFYSPNIDCRLKVELANCFRLVGLFSEAIPIYKELLLELTDSDILKNYLVCLYNEDRRVEFQRIFDSLRKEIKESRFYLRIAASFYSRTGKLDDAISSYDAYFKLHSDDLDLRLDWIITLARSKQYSKIKEFLASCIDYDDSLPEHRMHLAQTLKHYGFPEKAIALGYKVCRCEWRNQTVSDRFIGLMLLGNIPEQLLVAEVVADGVTFQIKNELEKIKNFSLESQEPLLEGEFSPKHPLAGKFLGKRVGDVVVVKPNPFEEESWEVTKIEPNFMSLYRKIFNGYPTFFPESKSFYSISVADEEGNPDFGTFFKILDSRENSSEKVLENYRSNSSIMPMPVLARMLGVNPLTLWCELGNSSGISVMCDSGDLDAFGGRLRELDKVTDGIVVDLLTLYLIHVLGIESICLCCFTQIGVAQTTKDDLITYIEDLKTPGRAGVMGKSKGRFFLKEFSPDETQSEIYFLEKIAKWTDDNCVVLPAVASSDFSMETSVGHVSNLLSHSFVDSIYASSGKGWPLISNDLAYRNFALAYCEVDGFSVQALMNIALQRECVTYEKYVHTKSLLCRSGFEWIFCTSLDFIIFFKSTDDVDLDGFKSMAEIFSSPNLDLNSGMAIVEDVLHVLWSGEHELRSKLTNIIFSECVKGKGAEGGKVVSRLARISAKLVTKYHSSRYLENMHKWSVGHFLDWNKILKESNMKIVTAQIPIREFLIY